MVGYVFLVRLPHGFVTLAIYFVMTAVDENRAVTIEQEDQPVQV